MSKSFGKTIRLFLLEGNTNGLITADLSNWTGKAFKVPRIKIKDYANREEFNAPGIYILFGKNESNEDAAYIGEGEPVIKRIKEHLNKKEFWNEVIIFVSKDKYLNKASIKFLEHRLHSIGNNANRYKIFNSNIPTQAGVSEAELAELEEFLSNIKLLTSTLGHKIFEEIKETFERIDNEEVILYLSSKDSILAKGSPSTEGFTVFKDSLFSKANHSSLTDSIKIEREKMIEEKVLISTGEYYKLTKPYTFTSSSRAATMIFSRSTSGPNEWKTDRGVNLRTIELAKV